MRNLDNCIAWITGGGTGIGQAGAAALAQAGATVVVSGRRREPLEETVKSIADAGYKAATNIPKRHWNEMENGGWEQVINININGAYYCIEAVLPGMYETYLSGAAYTTSKSALRAMSNSLNLEEGHNGIRSTSICPAEVATAFAKLRSGEVPDDAMQRALNPEDLGDTIAFVAQLPVHACINEIIISPADNRWYENNREMGA